MARASAEKIREWQERIENQKASGLSIPRWCKANQIAEHQFHYWKARLSVLSRDRFIEVKPSNSTITLQYKGVQIQLEEHFNVSLLKRCLEVLKAC